MVNHHQDFSLSIKGIALVLATLLYCSGCTSLPANSKISQSDEQFVRTELYFAIGRTGAEEAADVPRPGLGEARWQEFVDEVVTPLFPAGLTVFTATGQWLSDRFTTPPKLDTRVIVILHPDTAQANERIEEIRKRFLELTGQQSVLRVTQPAEVSF